MGRTMEADHVLRDLHMSSITLSLSQIIEQLARLHPSPSIIRHFILHPTSPAKCHKSFLHPSNPAIMMASLLFFLSENINWICSLEAFKVPWQIPHHGSLKVAQCNTSSLNIKSNLSCQPVNRCSCISKASSPR